MLPIYGIDLGTTFTKCALVRPNSQFVQSFKLDRSPETQENTLSLLRSAVTVGNNLTGRRIAYVGLSAMTALEDMNEGDPPLRRFEEAKIWIGEDAQSVGIDPPPWPFEPHGWKYRPEDIGALVLRKVKKEVEAAHEPQMTRIVLTYPQYFADARRKATLQAAEIAGLEVVETITEPDAAALAFGVATAASGKYMVFDSGGGTLDITIAEFAGAGSLRVLASDGVKAAGRDFDRVIFGLMVDEYRRVYDDFDPGEHLDAATRQIWMAKAEKAKILLNQPAQEVTSIKLSPSRTLFPDGQDGRLVLTREVFFDRSRGIVDGAIDCAESALAAAGLHWKDLVGILCVGGSSRLIHMRNRLNEVSEGRVLGANIDPEAAIAHGAAIYGHALATKQATIESSLGPAREDAVPPPKTSSTSPNPTMVQLIGALGRTLGVKAFSARRGADVVSPLIAKGTAIPCRITKTFRTVADDITTISVELYEVENQNDPEPDPALRLGTVDLTGFPTGPKGTPVEVSLSIEVNGTKHLHVAVKGKSTEAMIKFDPNKVLGEDEVKRRREFIESIAIL